MTLRTKKLTYQEYLEMTPVMGRCDIIDGELIMSSSPNRQHQTVLRQLFLGVNQFVTEHDLGEVWFASLDVVVREEPLRVRQPTGPAVRQQREQRHPWTRYTWWPRLSRGDTLPQQQPGGY